MICELKYSCIESEINTGNTDITHLYILNWSTIIHGNYKL